MKNVFAFALLAAIAAASSANAHTAAQTHVHVRVHRDHKKLYITPLGEQCAYNASIDPAEYPCRDGGVCVRKNATFGECVLPNATAAPGPRSSGNATVLSVEDSGDDDGSDDDSDDSSDSDDE